MSKNERSGWRDEDLSARHRLWGEDCPATDIDFLLIEYDNRKPVAIIDYKYWNRTASIKEDESNDCAVGKLYKENGDQIPFYRVWYEPGNLYVFKIEPINKAAKEISGPYEKEIDEGKYVRFLHALRGRDMPENVFNLFHKKKI